LVYHSTLGLRVIQKKKTNPTPWRRTLERARSRTRRPSSSSVLSLQVLEGPCALSSVIQESMSLNTSRTQRARICTGEGAYNTCKCFTIDIQAVHIRVAAVPIRFGYNRCLGCITSLRGTQLNVLFFLGRGRTCISSMRKLP